MKNFWRAYLEAARKQTFHRSELISIQWLRGVAVLMVMVYHVEDLLRLMPGWENFHSLWVRVGYSAPDLFFVISGFIMCYVTFGMKFEPRKWLVARFIRIYPLYFLFMLTAMTVWLIEPTMTMGSGVQTWETVGKSFLIFPQAGLPLVFVAWTLEHEIVFYFLVFCVAAMGGQLRSLTGVMMFLSGLSMARWFLKDSIAWLDFWDYHFLSLYMVQFTMGALIFQYQKQLQFLGYWGPVAAGIALFIFGGFAAETAPLNEEGLPRILIFGSAFSLALLGFINAEMARRQKEGDAYLPKKRPFFVKAGDASYSMYLCHPFFLSISGKILAALNVSGFIAAAAVALAGAGAVIFGMLFYEWVEKPLLQLMKTVTGKKRAPVQVGAG